MEEVGSRTLAATKTLKRLKEKIAAVKNIDSPNTKSDENNVSPQTVNIIMYCTGQVESVQYLDVDNVYCKYAITHGPDWSILHGADTGLSQIAYTSAAYDKLTLNFPIDITMKTTNPFGWPRIILSIYGLDFLGRDVVRGYGSCLLPTTSSSNITRTIRLFRPQTSSTMERILAWATGTQPEFYDSTFISQNYGREVTHVTSAGQAIVRLNVVLTGMNKQGYTASKFT